MRLIIFLLICYLIYRILKILITQKGAQEKPPSFEEMVRDGICNRYIMKRGAKSLRINGRIYYFCGDECMKKFKERQKQRG